MRKSPFSVHSRSNLWLLKTPYALTPLNFLAATHGLSARCPFDFDAADATRPGEVASRASPRGTGPAPSTAGASTLAPATVTPHESRPLALGVDVEGVALLANGARHRQAGDRHRVASSGPSLVVDVESRRRTGRPSVPADVRALIRTMSQANPLWSAPRIHGELLNRDLHVSQASVAKCMVRSDTPPSQTWRTFLANHIQQIAAADFFVVPTATCRLLFVLVILAHERRRVVHVAVTEHPTAAWTAQQLREAFPWNEAPRYLVRDRDSAFSAWTTTTAAIGIDEVLTAPRSPWQNAREYAASCMPASSIT